MSEKERMEAMTERERIEDLEDQLRVWKESGKARLQQIAAQQDRIANLERVCAHWQDSYAVCSEERDLLRARVTELELQRVWQ